jgi:hypothetical protein
MMRNPHLRLAVLGCCALTGCSLSQQPVSRNLVVGTYVYKSEDPDDRPTDHNLDRLVLESDGKYDFVRGGSTKPKVETSGNWKLWRGRDAVHVILDQSGYPVEVKGKDVRLLVDNDTGIWYQKIK